jgi:hypothetical protein
MHHATCTDSSSTSSSSSSRDHEGSPALTWVGASAVTLVPVFATAGCRYCKKRLVCVLWSQQVELVWHHQRSRQGLLGLAAEIALQACSNTWNVNAAETQAQLVLECWKQDEAVEQRGQAAMADIMKVALQPYQLAMFSAASSKTSTKSACS